MAESQVPKCPVAGCEEKPQALASSFIPASEWYFRKCHRSVKMESEVAKYFLEREAATRK